MKSLLLKRLYIFRIIGLALLCWSAYVFWQAARDDRPKRYWPSFRKLPQENIYAQNSVWYDQEGKTKKLSDFKGQVTVVGFVFLECKTFCPRIIGDLKTISTFLEKEKEQVNFVLFSFDNVGKKYAELQKFIKNYHLSEANWHILASSTKIVKAFADIFQVRYEVIDAKKFNYLHSNLIAIIDPDGKVFVADNGLTEGPEELVVSIRKLLKRKNNG